MLACAPDKLATKTHSGQRNPFTAVRTQNMKTHEAEVDERTHLTIEFKKIKFNVYVLYNK